MMLLEYLNIIVPLNHAVAVIKFFAHEQLKYINKLNHDAFPNHSCALNNIPAAHMPKRQTRVVIGPHQYQEDGMRFSENCNASISVI